MQTLPSVFLAAVLCFLGGCQTNEQTGSLLGISGGSIIGAALGKSLGRSDSAMVFGGLAGGTVGYFVGSSVGRSLDDRDRARAQSATVMALNAPLKGVPSPRPHAAQKVHTTHAPTTKWTSDHKTGAKGSATVTEVETTAAGSECRTVHEVAYIQGHEVIQDTKYCRNGNQEWQAAS